MRAGSAGSGNGRELWLKFLRGMVSQEAGCDGVRIWRAGGRVIGVKDC